MEICPMCEADYDGEDETLYTCTCCDSEGFGCCVNGDSGLCDYCTADDEEEYNEERDDDGA